MNEKEARELLQFASIEEYDIYEIDNIISNAKNREIVDFSFREQYEYIKNKSKTELIDNILFHKLRILTAEILSELETYEN